MRLLFTGAAPWVNSGYGKPHRYLLPRLVRAGHECALACFYGYQGATTKTQIGGESVRLYPPGRQHYFNDIIEYHAHSFEADAVISLQDSWILEDWGEPRGFRWLPWMPLDCEPLTTVVIEALEGCHIPLSYSRWGQGLLADGGWPDARYVPFGVDLEMHRIRDQTAARLAAKLPADGFIAGMVIANSCLPCRKSIPEVLLAWKQWTDGGGKGTLYLHTTISPKAKAGIDYPRLLKTLDVPWSTVDDPDDERRARASVLFPTQYQMWCGTYSDEDLAQIYSTFDVLLSPSMSEGFGIPILEAQACGIPVVTVNFSSMPELTFAGRCLEPIQKAWEGQGGWRAVAGVGDIAESLQWAYEMAGGSQASTYLAEKARAGAEDFGWDKIVAERWLPLLEELADDS